MTGRDLRLIYEALDTLVKSDLLPRPRAKPPVILTRREVEAKLNGPVRKKKRGKLTPRQRAYVIRQYGKQRGEDLAAKYGVSASCIWGVWSAAGVSKARK